MKQGYYIDEDGVRHTLGTLDDAENLTESFNSSRTVALLFQQYEEQCKQNRRLFFISIVTSLLSTGSLIVSIAALLK